MIFELLGDLVGMSHFLFSTPCRSAGVWCALSFVCVVSADDRIGYCEHISPLLTEDLREEICHVAASIQPDGCADGAYDPPTKLHRHCSFCNSQVATVPSASLKTLGLEETWNYRISRGRLIPHRLHDGNP